MVEGEVVACARETQAHLEEKEVVKAELKQEKEELRCELEQALAEREKAERQANEELERLQEAV